MAGKVGEGVIVIGADSGTFSKELHDQTGKAAKSAGEHGGNVFGDALETAFKRGAQLLGTGIAVTLGVGFKTAMDDEVAKMKFTQLFKGQVDKATGFIEELKQFAKATPFEFPGLEDAASRFLAVGVEADRVIPIMTNLGNITGIMGSGEEGVKRVTLALQQMALKGKVSSEEILQMSEAGVPALKLLSEQMGIPTGELQKMIEKGLVPASKMFDAFGNDGLATMQTFQGGMEKMSQTTEGKLSTLKDTFSQFAARLVSDAVPAINGFVSTLTDQVIPAVEENIGKFRTWITSIDFSAFLDTVKLVWDYVVGFVTDATVREWADRAVEGVQVLASWVKDTLVPALVDLVGKVRDVVNWFRDNEGAAKALGATVGGVLALITAAWVAQGVVAVENGIKSVIAWMSTATASTTSATIQSKSTAQIVFGWVAAGAAAILHGAKVIAQFILMGVMATIHGAIVAGAWLGAWLLMAAQATIHAVAVAAVWIGSWVAQAAQAVVSAAITAGAWVGAWLLMAVQAGIHAVAIAAAWLVAFWPIALIVAAVIGLAIIVVKNLDTIKEWISNTWDNITSITYNVWNSIWSFFENIWTNITNAFNSAVEGVKTFLSNAWEWIKSVTSTAWETIKLLILGPIGVVMLLTGKNMDDMKGMISGAWESIKAWTSNAWETVKNFISTALENIKTAVSQKFNDVIGFFQGLPGRIVGAIGDLGRLLWDKGTSAVQSLLDGAMEKIRAIGSWASDIKDNIINAIKAVFGIHSPSSVFADLGINMMKGLLQGLLQGPEILRSAVKTISGNLIDWLGGLGSRVGEFFSGLFGGGTIQAGKVNFAGKLLDTDTAARLQAALGGAFRLNQGSWSTSVAASMGTHAGSGVADITPVGMSWGEAVARLNAAGLRAIFRNWPGNQHIHLLNPNVTGQSPQALQQLMGEFSARRMFGYAGGTPSAIPGWAMVGERGPEWVRFRGGETVLSSGRTPAGNVYVTLNVSVDDLDKMAKVGDFLDMLDRARLDNRRTARSGMVAA